MATFGRLLGAGIYGLALVVFVLVVCVPVALVLLAMYVRDNGDTAMKKALHFIKTVLLFGALCTGVLPGAPRDGGRDAFIDMCLTTENTSQCTVVHTNVGL